MKFIDCTRSMFNFVGSCQEVRTSVMQHNHRRFCFPCFQLHTRFVKARGAEPGLRVSGHSPFFRRSAQRILRQSAAAAAVVKSTHGVNAGTQAQ